MYHGRESLKDFVRQSGPRRVLPGHGTMYQQGLKGEIRSSPCDRAGNESFGKENSQLKSFETGPGRSHYACKIV
jgi:hypothetical protein